MEQGFLASLFDLSFQDFITTRIVKVLFILGIIGAGLWAVVFLFAGLAQGGAFALGALIGAPLGFLMIVLGTRVWLELIIVVFRVADNTAELVAQGKSNE